VSTLTANRPRRRALVAPTRRLHLTPRGRLLVLAGLVLLLLAAFTVGRTANSQASDAPTVSPVLAEVTVEPGDTLWAVARRVAPDRDPRDVVAQIRRLNHLPSSVLQVGQELLLPLAV